MKLSIVIEALTGKYETDLKRAQRETERAAKQMRDDFRAAGVEMGKALGAGAAAATIGLAALVKQAINAADQLQNMSQKVGVSAQSLSTLGYAAKQSDVELAVLQSSLVRLAKNASDAAKGTGTAVQGFDALGISVKNADGSLKNSDVLLKEIAGRFAGFEDGANKTALAVNLFGKAGADLIPLLNEGSAGIAELEERARALGLEISGDTAAKSEAFNDLLEDGADLARGFGNDIAKDLIGPLGSLAESFVENGIQGRAASEGTTLFSDSLKGLIAGAIIAKNTVEMLTNGIAAAVDTAAAAAEAARNLGQIANPLSTLSEMVQGNSLQTPSAILDEFQRTANAAMASAATGVGDSMADIKSAVDALYPSMQAANDVIDETAEAAKGAAPALVDLNRVAADAAKVAKELEKAKKAEADRQRAYADMVHKSAEEERKWVAEQKAAAAAQKAIFDAQARDIQNEIDLLGLSGDARRELAVAIEAERLARNQNGEVVEAERVKFQKLLTELDRARELESIVVSFEVEGFDDLIEKIRKMGAELRAAGDTGSEDVDKLRESLGNAKQEAFLFATDAIGQGITSLQSMAEEGSSAYKKLEVAQAALNLATAIGAIANQGMGDPYTAFARIAAMIAAMNQLGLAVSGGGGASPQSAEVRQESQGTGTVLGDAEAKSESILNATEITADATTQLVGINRGMLRALQTLESGIGSASGMLARGAGTADVGPLASGTGGFLGSLPDPLGLTDMIFGGSQELIDQGIVIAGGALNDMLQSIVVGAYNTVETDGGWFGGDDVDTNVTDITAEFGDQFQLIIQSIADTVREGALALGLLPADIEQAIAQFQVEEIRISLMGLSAEEQQAELQAVFSSIFDGLAADVVPFIEQFQQLGEGLGETLVRVATGVQVTQEAMLQLGFQLDELDPERFAQVSEGLIGLAGGIDEFISSMQSFVSNFAPEAHQFEVAQDAITRAFAQFGLEVPATREGMWELMQSLDATTESGREQIAMLLRLAGVSDAYYDALEDQAADAARAAAEAAELLEEAAARAADAEQARIEAMHLYAATVVDMNRQLYELSGATEFRMSLQDIREQYQQNVAALTAHAHAAGIDAARTEDLTTAMNLQARQVARLRAELDRSIDQAASGLGYTPLGVINAQIEAMRASEEEAAASLQRFQQSIRDTGRIASDVAAAMLGEGSPLSGEGKADYALQALADGAISLDAALSAGREAFASGRDWDAFFQRAIGIAGDRREEEPENVGQTVSLAMRELLEEQARLQEEQARSERMLQAQDVAAMIADAAAIDDVDWREILAARNIGLEPLLADLGMTEEQFDEWIAQQQQQQQELDQWFATNITADGHAIVEEIRVLSDLLRNPDPLLNPPTPDPVTDPPGGKDPPWTGGPKSAAELQEEQNERIDALTTQVETLTSVIERLMTTGNRHTGAIAAGVSEMARNRGDAAMDAYAKSSRTDWSGA